MTFNKELKNDKKQITKNGQCGIVVESLDEAISFFTELGLKLEGRAMKNLVVNEQQRCFRNDRELLYLSGGQLRLANGYGGITLLLLYRR